MTLWLNRTGKRGQHESKFLDDDRIYLTWEGLKYDLSTVSSKPALRDLLQVLYPGRKERNIAWSMGQIWAWVREMKPGDWVAVPSKMKAAIHNSEITGPYVFDPKAEDPYYHYRTVKWIETDIPRSSFAPDLLMEFGAQRTIYEVRHHDAENRVRAMVMAGWKSADSGKPQNSTPEDESIEGELDLETLAMDRIAELIISRFKGHGMAVLVEALLKAQGYFTYRSPPGPDRGVDILAAPGPIGFGEPKIAVQVKSGDGPVDRPTLDQLVGTMQNFHATQGLLVSWGGFKSSTDKELAAQFFKVRLWDQKALIDQLLEHYDKLGEDVRGELPLKRIWTVVESDEDEGGA